MKLPKAILFDWDETLAHTRDCVVEAMEYVLKKYRKESWNITKKRCRDPKKSLKDNFPNFFGDDYVKVFCFKNSRTYTLH